MPPIIEHRRDHELIEEIQKGNPILFEKLISPYLPLVLAFLRTRGAGSSDCEDIAQGAFLKAFQNLGTYTPMGSFVRWLLTIARNQLVDHLRKSQCDQRLLQKLPNGFSRPVLIRRGGVRKQTGTPQNVGNGCREKDLLWWEGTARRLIAGETASMLPWAGRNPVATGAGFVLPTADKDVDGMEGSGR